MDVARKLHSVYLFASSSSAESLLSGGIQHVKVSAEKILCDMKQEGAFKMQEYFTVIQKKSESLMEALSFLFFLGVFVQNYAF